MSRRSANATSCAGSRSSWGTETSCSGIFSALDSFELNRSIYQIPRADFLALRDELIELLEVGDLVRKP